MTEAMPFLRKIILLSYDPRPFFGGTFLLKMAIQDWKARRRPSRREKQSCGLFFRRAISEFQGVGQVKGWPTIKMYPRSSGVLFY